MPEVDDVVSRARRPEVQQHAPQAGGQVLGEVEEMVAEKAETAVNEAMSLLQPELDTHKEKTKKALDSVQKPAFATFETMHLSVAKAQP